jgi:serine/threonine protein kinase
MKRTVGRTSTASSGFSRTSTVASTPLVSSVRVSRKRSSESSGVGPSYSDLYYRAVVYPFKDMWDMLTVFSDCELVGRGSYGEVVRASFGSDTVAIKRVEILEDDHSSDWENGLRLVREIFFLKNLKHPNLSSLMCLFPNTGPHLRQIHIVIRFFSEGSLSKYSPESISEVVEIQKQILSGLSYMHKRDLLHRDVKRENVFVQISPRKKVHVVLGDFGLSRACVRSGMTAEVVTKPYRCPSLLLGASRYGPEVDVYAAGLVLLEILFGKLNTTLLPNRKIALKNFVRYQLALALPERLSNRLLSLSSEMHLDIDELIDSLWAETDFDNKLAMEWSRQVWSSIQRIYEPPEHVVKIAKRMVAFDPLDRCSLDDALAVFDPQFSEEEISPAERTNVSETFDADISVLPTDEARAEAIKLAIRGMINTDPLVGPYLALYEPVSRRTRFQRRVNMN